ncbi:MAG TPA: 50S ribosomal protein L11 methyltransferase [Bacteroidota bacterium]|nr:50S ribosomal protein L11 methyltransferase [Bacteroidota bacterium]
MKTFLQISVSGSKAQAEALLPSLIELGCIGFQETDTHLIGYAEMPSAPEESARLKEALHDTLRRISVNAEITFAEVADRNWNAEWERTIRPIEVGKKIAISPSWCEYRNDAGRIVLTIDPKMSFGTGYHETTRLMLLLIEKYTREGMFVLDVGTGTGVLAIAAVKLGAGSAVGTDIDEWAVANALENVRLNGAGHLVGIFHGSIPENLPSKPGMICANLSLNELRALLGRFRELLHGEGLLLVSGLLAEDEGQIGSALDRAGFRIVETVRENEWLAICAR